MMKLAMITAIVLVGLPVAVARPDESPPDAPVPDHELGLSRGVVGEVASPPAEMTNTSDPGDLPTTSPDFPQQPPLVAHGVEEFLPITRNDNQCVDCHEVDEKVEGEPTPIPASHYTDLRNDPDTVGRKLVGARYACVTCHVSPGGNDPLVENHYRPGELAEDPGGDTP